MHMCRRRDRYEHFVVTVMKYMYSERVLRLAESSIVVVMVSLVLSECTELILILNIL